MAGRPAFFTDDVKAAFERAVRAGDEVVAEAKVMSWNHAVSYVRGAVSYVRGAVSYVRSEDFNVGRSIMSMPILQTQRLVLRPFEESDAPVVQALVGIPEVALTTKSIPYPYEDGMAEEWIASHGPAWDEGKALTLAVTSERDGLVAAVGLHINKTHRRGELGYWVGLPFWNRGYATEAAGAMLDVGFRELDLNRVQARFMPRNTASGRVMEKLGMSPEGIQRQYFLVRGTFEDIAMYAILRSQYLG